MSAFEKYGLDAMGIDDPKSFNETMIGLVKEVFGESDIPQDNELGFNILNQCLDELFYKAERITDGYSTAFRMFSTERGDEELTEKTNTLMRKLFDEISKVWHYSLKIVGNQLKAI